MTKTKEEIIKTIENLESYSMVERAKTIKEIQKMTDKEFNGKFNK